MLPVRSAIAVGVPWEIREWSDEQLRVQLVEHDSVKLRFAIVSATISVSAAEVTLQDQDVGTWPAGSYVTGTVGDLADLCEYASAPPEVVEKTAAAVAKEIKSLAHVMHRILSTNIATDIAATLGQRGAEQGLRLACCIWLTSLRLQNLLAERSSRLRAKGLKTTAQLRSEGIGNVLTPDPVRAEWDKILTVNYGAIFHTARTALDERIPVDLGSHVLSSLAQLVESIVALRLGNRVDFAGELFPLLLDDREETAAHYTLPETAELLGRLAVDRLPLMDWANQDLVDSLRVADLACGTGTLLRASYGHIRRRHESAGGDAVDLHLTMMERALTGLDINALASHMTAAGLSTSEIEIEYHRTNIAAVAVEGGLTGSLELLESDQITDILGQRARSAAATRAEPVVIGLPNNSQDLVIQNPPYVRARGDRKMFDVTGITEAQRQQSVNRLTNIRNRLRSSGNEIINGQAGLGADFSALALRKLKPGGVFATVLPLTAAHADSWEGFRRTIERECRNVTAISFPSHQGAMMSADTYMNEMLLIATKKDSGQKKNASMVGSSPVTCVNLNSPPASDIESAWYSKWIDRISQSPRTNDILYEAGRKIGSWIRLTTPVPGFPWFAIGTANQDLSTTIAELMDGRLYLPDERQTWNLSLPFTTLSALVDIGPTHDLVGSPRGGDGRGAFTFDEIEQPGSPTYAALWAANSKAQRTILVSPTHTGTPTSDDDTISRMLDWRSDLFISRNLRMTSQALAAATTDRRVMGGRAWTALVVESEGVKAALALWLNSTLGLMLRVAYAQTTQLGRATMQINALRGFPVPDFANDADEGHRARDIALKHITKLSSLQLEPVSYSFRDKNRHRIDLATLEMLGLGEDQQVAQAVADLQDRWCREPSVHGGSKPIMKALGIQI